jgi:hypothetical protein
LVGAAVNRCDSQLIFIVGFSRCGNAASQKNFFRSRSAAPQSREIS